MKAWIVALIFTAVPLSAAAQNSAAVITNAPIYVSNTPGVSLAPLRVAAAGTVLKVVAEQVDWLQVQYRGSAVGPTHWLGREETCQGVRRELEAHGSVDSGHR